MSPAQSDGKAVHLDPGSEINLPSNTCKVVGNGRSCCSHGSFSLNSIVAEQVYVADVGLKRGDINMTSCAKGIAVADDIDDYEAAKNSSLILAKKVDNNSHLSTKIEEVLAQHDDGMFRDRGKGTCFGQCGCCFCVEDVELASSSGKAEETDMADGYETPSEGMFDPFAPGPKELARAPKKCLSTKSRLPLRRQLRFDSSSDSFSEGTQGSESDDSTEDDGILEVIYLSFMEVITESQYEEGLPIESISSVEPTTPVAVHLLTGIVDTCPGAPLRHVNKSREIDPSICRKLNFSAEDI